MHYEFYIDAYIVTNFFFDYLTLFLIREVRRKQTKTGRMAVMALLGVLSAAASMLLLKNAGIYKILVHLLWMGYGRHSRSGDYIFTPVSGPEGGRKNL